MRTIELTHGRVAYVDDDDYERLILCGSWCVTRQGYATNGKYGLMHRFITCATSGEIVDHINHDRLDNRRHNLRLANQSINMMNRKDTIRPGFTSKFRGVAHRGGKDGVIRNDRGYLWNPSKPWVVSYKKRYLAVCEAEEEAAYLYDLAALRDQGPGAQLNFPLEGLQ